MGSPCAEKHKTPVAPPPQSGRARHHLRGLVRGSSRAARFRVSGKNSAARRLLGHAASHRDRSVRRRGLEPDQERTDPSLSRTIRYDRLTPTATDSDAKCAIARRPVTIGDDSFSAPSARPEWDLALHHALVARATELASTLPADAVESALTAALTSATSEGRWSDVAALAHPLGESARRRGQRSRLGLAAGLEVVGEGGEPPRPRAELAATPWPSPPLAGPVRVTAREVPGEDCACDECTEAREASRRAAAGRVALGRRGRWDVALDFEPGRRSRR